jgi:DNA invertase Pin-like site-specific DNA recombinase
MPLFISYLRVSTDKQGRSGLGLEAQRAAVERHVSGAGGKIVAEFLEVESGGKKDRPQLTAALAACRVHKKAVLIVAKLDRLARNVAFVSALMESGVEFVAADMPTVNRLTIHILAAVAEEEARMISARTKAALAAAKARGIQLGNPRLRAGTSDQARAAAAAKSRQADARATDLMHVIQEIRAAGLTTLAGIAGALAARGIPTPGGRGQWYPATVAAVLARCNRLFIASGSADSTLTATLGC